MEYVISMLNKPLYFVFGTRGVLGWKYTLVLSYHTNCPLTAGTMDHADASVERLVNRLRIRKPANEAFGALWCGMLWGVLAFRNRSVLSGLVQRYVMAIGLDYFICYGPGLR